MKWIWIFCFLFVCHNLDAAALSQENLRIAPDAKESEAGQFFLKASADGVDVDFLLDTGATFTSVVGVDAFKSYPEIKKIEFSGISGAIQKGSTISLKTININGDVLNDIKVVRLPEGDGRRSTIGIDVLKNRSFSFSPKSKRIHFHKKEMTNSLPLEIGKVGHIYLSAQLSESGPTLVGIWDTGAGLTLIDIADVKANPSNFVFVKSSSGDDTTGSQLTLPIYNMKFLKIGSLKYRDVKILAADLSGMRKAIGDNVRMAIGHNVIVKNDWFFNLKSRRWAAN